VKTYPFHKLFPAVLLLVMAFFAGRGVADCIHHEEKIAMAESETKEERELSQGASSEGIVINKSYTENWPFALNSPLQPGTENWGLGFGPSGEKPVGNATVAEMKAYNASYVGEGDEKKIYLTFDCGYENGNTEAILDALKKHHVTATFFVVGHYLETAPELVKRMVAEGHVVGNHTYHHPDMSKISDLATFQKEMDDVRTLYQEVTGQEMIKYYRPPQGKYNQANLQMAKDLGYHTFFWSLAYVDWNVNDQPTREEALSKLTTRIHPGAIVLLHNTSKTNAEVLDELLTKWEEMGYAFSSLDELCTVNEVIPST